MNRATLYRKAVGEALTQRILSDASALYLAQRTLAVGSLRVFRIDERSKGSKATHTLVTDPDEILDLLNEHGGPDVSDGGAINGKFYFFSTVMPDNRALDSLFNRALGKPMEHIKHETVDPKKVAAEVLETLQGPKYGLSLEAAKAIVVQEFGDVFDGVLDRTQPEEAFS
jgi:hypothetical protein